MSVRIRVNEPYITDDDVKSVVDVLRSKFLSHSDVVNEFEREFANYLGVKHVVTVSNGTAALYLILKALGIGDGDEVIVPDFTFFATASTVVMVGAKPVFADINLRTYNIDPKDIEAKVTSRTKAVIAVHLYGHPAKVDEIRDVCDKYGLYLVEDAAQAHGAEFMGRKVGSLGDVAAFSFYATKNLTMGEGGAVVTDDDELAERIKLLRNHGQLRKYYHVVVGGNFRLTSIQAALGLSQLRKLDWMNSRRRELAKVYGEYLSGLSDYLGLPIEEPWAKHVYHQYVIWVKKPLSRDEVASYLNSRGIETAIHYPIPLHEQPVFKPSSGVCCPNSIEASRHVLSLPMHPNLTLSDVEYVSQSIKEYVKKFKNT